MKALTVDDKQRVRLPDAKPRQVYSYRKEANGTITLTEVVPASPPKARIVRKGGGIYLVNDLHITNEDVQRAMENFP